MKKVKAIILLGIAIGLGSIVYAIPNRVVRTTPIMPATFLRSATPQAGNAASAQAAFVHTMETLKSKKDLEIPGKRSPGTIRIMTYNIQELLSQGNYLTSQLQELGADIMMLQLDTANAAKSAAKSAVSGATSFATLIKICTQLGYSHYTRLDRQAVGDAGCIIVSKIPLAVSVSKKHAQKSAGSPARFYVKVEIDLSAYGKKNLVLYGVYFDGQDATIRLAQAQELVASVQRHDQGKNVIIGGDFNEGHGAAINYLGSQGFIDSFDLAGVAKPTFTHWSRQVLDRLFVDRKSWNIWLDGAFVFYPGARHHTPVIMDIDPT